VFRRILVALDGSAPSEQVLPYAAVLADSFGASLTLLRAVPPAGEVLAEAGPLLDPTPVMEEEHHEAADYLGGLCAGLRRSRPGLAVDCEEVEGAPAEVIVARARERGADLIAMATTPPAGLRRLLFGGHSIAGDVLKHARCRVLLVPVSEEGHQQGT